MNTFKKMRLIFIVSIVGAVLATLLKTLAMFCEFEAEIGFFAHKAPINLAANIAAFLTVLIVIGISFAFKKREIFPLINYSSSFFRFFASTSGCLMLVYAYVKWQEYSAEKLMLSDANIKKLNFLLIMSILSVLSFFALMVYAFGKNETNKPQRAFLGLLPASVILVRAIEIQFDGAIEMNDPIKISFQIASVALMLAILYTVKCEFNINETAPHMRLITLMAAPVLVAAFAIPTVICYYAKVNTEFSYLVDALLQISLFGFVISSYTPCAKAKPVCDDKWHEFDLEVASLNGRPYGEGFKDRLPESEEQKTEENLPEETGVIEAVEKSGEISILEGISEAAVSEETDAATSAQDKENNVNEGDKE